MRLMNLFHKTDTQKPVLITRANDRNTTTPGPAAAFFNRFSLVFHMLLACMLCFVIEVISRRSFTSAVSFVTGHCWAFLYNSFIIFSTLSIVYLLRRRALMRFLISGFWLFLGTINGCILAKRVTPFGFTDLKCIQDLFAMQNTNYFTLTEALLVLAAVGCFVAFSVFLWKKGPKYQGKPRRLQNAVCIAVLCCLMLPITTQAAQNKNIVASYFTNIAQGYEDYGFVYGFSSSVVDRGINKPDDYSEKTIANITEKLNRNDKETTIDKKNAPNIIVILLESFVDPSEISFLNCSEDPIPTFHNLEKNFSTGHLTVPVVGAGTANTEFEVLTGMSMEYFGTGEYPYKTTLKQTDCESLASDLSQLGYGTHVVHNNTGNFYSRANAFSQMGFDTFTSKELMNIRDYTALGSWPKDNILVNETLKALDSTEGSDFVYTITVQGHGDYPTHKVLANPAIRVDGAKDQESNYQWEYYINQIHEVDQFINNLTSALNKRGEDTMVVFFGDHLPSLNLQSHDMKTGSIFKTKYVTWNNFGMKKKDRDLTSYQLMAAMTAQAGIHEGTMFTYHQDRMQQPGDSGYVAYKDGMDNLQYDLLYGKRYAYDGKDKYPATDLVMGLDELSIDYFMRTNDGKIRVYGENFTSYSKIAVNGKVVDTKFVSDAQLLINEDDITEGDRVCVQIYGSRSTLFRESPTYIFENPRQIGSQSADQKAEVAPQTDDEK
ncbi:MAG: LTA synthase family protein [Lachnospiraceae bacterium]